jgi:hypothetical protein
MVNIFYKVIVTSDNGLLFCGQVGKGPSLNQDGWLLKTDEWGCDTIGCQLLDGIADKEGSTYLFTLYPNPASEKITVRFDAGSQEPGVYEIMDLTGRLIQQGKFNDPVFSIDVSNLPSSLYLFRLRNKNEIKTELFSVAR